MTGSTFFACVAVFFAIAVFLGLLADRRFRRMRESERSIMESASDLMGIAAFLLVASFGSAVLS